MTTTQTEQERQTWRDRARQVAERGQDVYEEGDWFAKLFSWLVLSGLIAALAYISWLNIAPYVLLAKQLGGGSENWLTGLPLLGAIVAAWSGFVVTLVGVLVWALVQALQCLWLLISLDKRALQGAVNQAQAGRFNLAHGTDGATRSIARKARKIPYFFIRWGALLSLGAYAFDLVVGLSLYPPAQSFGKFMFALSSGMWSSIDLTNLTKLLIMLFAFEFVLVLFLVVLQWSRTREAT